MMSVPASRPRNSCVIKGSVTVSAVFKRERDRLRRAGRDDLADHAPWVSDLDGDGYGYDVSA
jgi:hypothetical protein